MDVGKCVFLCFFYFNNCIYLFLAVLDIRCCTDFSLVVVLGLLIAVVSVAVEHRLQAHWVQ